jgi:hypothetical protein
MVACVQVNCPNCDRVFLVNPKLEKLGIQSQCPFCEHQFLLSEAKRIVRGSPMILVK